MAGLQSLPSAKEFLEQLSHCSADYFVQTLTPSQAKMRNSSISA